MKQGDIAELEKGKEVKLIRSIGGKEQHENDYSQFWEVEDDTGKKDVMLLYFKKTPIDNSNKIKK